MINFKEIQNLYPGAYALLVSFLFPKRDSNLDGDYLIQPNNDRLYDFFDHYDIYIMIDPWDKNNYTGSDIMKNINNYELNNNQPLYLKMLQARKKLPAWKSR